MLVAQDCQVGTLAIERERSEAEKKLGKEIRERRERDESADGELKLCARPPGQVPDERTQKRQPMLMIRLN
ncbi:hypothetical protein ALC56_08042 [Trachymyrmex septentrionalis]|uniref:Uncharacterized protein n=1 Tax=Trachymyrmex septentrionalis TaxID=34720 RepID=A0A195FBQ7_9HYME|nr:hypothetical protein ALC56_08042 [Trachymyrmex septentrionalis]